MCVIEGPAKKNTKRMHIELSTLKMVKFFYKNYCLNKKAKETIIINNNTTHY